MYKITKTDEVILTNLSLNARVSESDLARACRKSKDTVRYRIRKLETAGIIAGYTALLDYTKLGATNYKLYIQTHNQQQVIELFDAKPALFARFTACAEWNVGLAFFCRSQQEYSALENELYTKFGKDLKQVTLCHMVAASVFQSRAFDKTCNETRLFGEITMNTLDETDRAILEALLVNSRQSFVSIAEKAKTTVNTIRRRMDALRKIGVLAACIAEIRWSTLGYENYKLFIAVQNFTPEAEKRLLQKIADIPQCINHIRMLGPWKIEAEFSCKTYDDMHSIMQRLQEDSAVLSLRYAIYRDEKYFPSKKVL